VDGRLVLFDWAHAAQGPVALDAVFFLPSLVHEAGFDPTAMLDHYRSALEAHDITVPEDALTAQAALTAGYFAARAGLAVPPELPRLRRVQRAQLAPALRFAAERLGLPPPPATRP